MKNEENENKALSQTAVSDRMCYVVECSAGSYDDYHTWIAGIFPDAIDAENLKNEITAKVEADRNMPCPYTEEEIEFLTDEQSEKYHNWWFKNNEAEEFNSAKVVEYPFGKSCR